MFEIDEQSRITRLRGKELEMVERTRGDEILSWDRVAPSQKEQLKNWPKDKHALRVSPFTGEPVIPSDQIRKSNKKIEIPGFAHWNPDADEKTEEKTDEVIVETQKEEPVTSEKKKITNETAESQETKTIEIMTEKVKVLLNNNNVFC